jgi:hypothetical protein
MGDRVRLRKPHPCGSFEWRITRLGADIGLRCEGCDRKVLLPRAQLRKRMKKIVTRAEDLRNAGTDHLRGTVEDEIAQGRGSSDTPSKPGELA